MSTTTAAETGGAARGATLEVVPTGAALGAGLPDDTSAEVTSEGLLGGRYVSLVPGGSEKVLADGGRITQTQGSVSLESLLGRFIFSVTQMNAGQSGGQSGGAEGAAPR